MNYKSGRHESTTAFGVVLLAYQFGKKILGEYGGQLTGNALLLVSNRGYKIVDP
jgi:hypothetical protein